MKKYARHFFTLLLLLCFFGVVAGAASAQSAQANDQKWGLDQLSRLDQHFWIPQMDLYADSIMPGQSSTSPSAMWSCGVQLSALNAGAHLDPAVYLPQLRHYLLGLDDYWIYANGVAGYQVFPNPNPVDRYYDDNAWMLLALCDAYQLTGDRMILGRAKQVFQFLMSGEDNVLGGGIYWHEQQKNSKNTCDNAPAICGALRLYQITKDPQYLSQAQTLYSWVNAHLQDTDGLYFDNINLAGQVQKTKWSYNSALMIRANVLFYQITGKKSYLAEAERIAGAAKAYWVDPATGAIKDGASFAHLLSEAFLFLYAADHDAQWLHTTEGALNYLHSSVRDADGFYGGAWNKPTDPAAKIDLINQAAAARGYLMAAIVLKSEK